MLNRRNEFREVVDIFNIKVFIVNDKVLMVCKVIDVSFSGIKCRVEETTDTELELAPNDKFVLMFKSVIVFNNTQYYIKRKKQILKMKCIIILWKTLTFDWFGLIKPIIC
jgi:hypothetical protein